MQQSQQPNHDSLDREIDALLASQPLEGDKAFNDRVLQAIQTSEPSINKHARLRPRIVRFALPLALPLAAAIAIAVILWPSIVTMQPTPQNQSLLLGETSDILLLESSLSNLLSPEINNAISTANLMSTLDAAAYSL